MIRPFIASLCVAATLATGSIAASAASPAPATPAPPPNVSSLHPSTVLTDINGYVTATSASRQCLVVVGQDLDQRPFVAANTTYTIIDIGRHNLITRRNTNGTIDNTVIDDRRGVVYLTVQTVPDRTSGAGTSYHVDLWTIRLSDGRLLSRRLFYEGEAATMNAMGVDESTGHLFIATTRPGSGTYELLMIDPASMAIHIQSLEGIPDHVFVDSVHHQAVVTTQVGIAAQTSKFIAFDTRSENRTWSHLFQYILSSYANFAMVYNPGTQQIWSVAPGGLVTIVAASPSSPRPTGKSCGRSRWATRGPTAGRRSGSRSTPRTTWATRSGPEPRATSTARTATLTCATSPSPTPGRPAARPARP